MNRTKNLLMSITASALLTGTATTHAAVAETRVPTSNAKTFEPDPPANAEKAILRILKEVELEQAVTLDQILAKDHSLKRNTVSQALAALVSQKKVSQTGSGSNPRYYNPQAAENRRVDQATLAVLDVCGGLTQENAASLEDILMEKPELDREIAKKAIAKLLNQLKIRRTGDGTNDKPYKYFGGNGVKGEG